MGHLIGHLVVFTSYITSEVLVPTPVPEIKGHTVSRAAPPKSAAPLQSRAAALIM